MDGLSGASLDSAFLFTFIDIAKPASHVGIHESYENWLSIVRRWWHFVNTTLPTT